MAGGSTLRAALGKVRGVFVPLFVPLLLGVVAFSISTLWARRISEHETPVTTEIWEAVLRDRHYAADRRNPGPLSQAELPEAEVWSWPEEQRVQLGTWTFSTAQNARPAPPRHTPLSLGTGWAALSKWVQMTPITSMTPLRPRTTEHRDRIWY